MGKPMMIHKLPGVMTCLKQLQDGCDPHIEGKCPSVTGTSACAIAKQAQTTTEFFASRSVGCFLK
jgi:hypothetical protein